MDSLPYIDPPNDEAYETYALSLIEEEMKRRRPPQQPTQQLPGTGQELLPTGEPFIQRKAHPLSTSSSLEEHIEALTRAKRSYESERIRQLQLSNTSELPFKRYNETVLDTAGWTGIAVSQKAAVDEINHQRKTYQEGLQPQLTVAETQYQELVQKNLMLRSAIQDLRSELESL